MSGQQRYCPISLSLAASFTWPNTLDWAKHFTHNRALANYKPAFTQAHHGAALDVVQYVGRTTARGIRYSGHTNDLLEIVRYRFDSILRTLITWNPFYAGHFSGDGPLLVDCTIALVTRSLHNQSDCNHIVPTLPHHMEIANIIAHDIRSNVWLFGDLVLV